MKIILVHGSKNYISKSKWTTKISKTISKKLFGKDTKQYMDDLEKYLKEKGYNVEQFKWSESIQLSEIRNEAKKLHRELKKEEKILIVAKSNGGILSQYALLGLDQPLIQIGTPNINLKTNLHIINIYSNTDKTQQRGIEFYQLTTGHVGSRKLYGEHVRNIAIDGLNHEDFDKEENYKIYEDIIEKTIRND